ncbi:DUF2267 domain-containing protein [Mesorhizobium sp. 1M-11]|uniref:DUF2267 domain-containing protein n=1 Tax=Mesorhizobium sp. 1M-11 TaxID=1529006 RepID=UPI0006C73858|nr:DUF2267 domain-containing protein [Mesorhizobium sp. 1M-11]
MAGTGFHTSQKSFQHAAEQAQRWVNELAKDLDWNEQDALRLLKTVLHAVRDWLSLEEIADFSSQLPTLIRGMFFEGWSPTEPARGRSKRDFVIRVRHGFGYEPNLDYDIAIGAVFQLLDHHLSHGETVQVRNSMKKSLRHLWPHA